MEEDHKPQVELPSTKEIKPLRDFHISCNDDNIEIKKGEKIRVPEKYLPNLKTEKVIK